MSIPQAEERGLVFHVAIESVGRNEGFLAILPFPSSTPGFNVLGTSYLFHTELLPLWCSSCGKSWTTLAAQHPCLLPGSRLHPVNRELFLLSSLAATIGYHCLPPTQTHASFFLTFNSFYVPFSSCLQEGKIDFESLSFLMHFENPVGLEMALAT